ncbi:MAG: right-handed parallel beta-helix repeat-containing protein, partial [Limisphaerales bacterium]
RMTLAAPHLYGVMQGNPSPRRFRAINVLEELDQPGEFAIDTAVGIIFAWPLETKANAPMTMSTLDAPIVSLRGVSHVVWRGFTIECGLGDGMEIVGSTNCSVEACTVRNVRQMGIQVNGGLKNRIVDCDIHDTGTGGLKLAGGDRKTLMPGGHEAVNNHIWRFSQHQFTSAYGLVFGGVGCRAVHNLIHDAPHQAIFVGGNDHVFELNEVHRVCTETDDCGALYKGRNPSCRGNVIRFNYWHDIGSPMGHGNAALYFDDGDGGDLIFGNIFARCGEPGDGGFGAVFSHGGHDLRAENNIFIDCKRALGSVPWDDARWRNALNGGEDCFFPDKLLKEVDITKPPYTTRYPELVGFMNPPPNSRISRAKLNVFVRCGEISGGNWQLDPAQNWATNGDPGFVATNHYTLRPDSEVFRRLKGFVSVPFDKMGEQGR